MSELRPIAGPAIPFRFDSTTGSVSTETGTDKVLDDVKVLLRTRIGERLMSRSYGTRLPGLVHDPNDEILVDIAEDQARQALMQWEPRVMPTAVRATSDPDDGQLQLELDLNLPGTTAVVIPFPVDRNE